MDPALLDGIYGDLQEEYHQNVGKVGRRRAQLQLILSALGFLHYRRLFRRKKIRNTSPITPDMIRNHLVVSLRNLFKNRAYTFISIVGLTISFACCLLIGLYVQEELSYDRYHEKRDRIYRLACHVQGASYENGIAKVSEPWGPEAEVTIPEVEDACRFVFYGQTLVSNGADRFYERGGMFADSTVFEVFSWNVIQGDARTALSAPGHVVLTKTLAEKYYPGENPVGQSLIFDNDREMTVAAEVEDVPANSHFTFSFLVPLHAYTPPDHGDKWTRWNQYYTYLLLKPGAVPEKVSNKVDEMLARHVDQETSDAYTPLLQPITDIHLHSKLHREMSTNGDMSYVYLFAIVALMTLVIATTNFINLFTARATHRAKEVGVRKVVGANRRSIIHQFIIEALLVTTVAAALAVFLAKALLPALNLMLSKSLQLDLWSNLPLTLSLLALVILTGAVSGAYPAAVLSSLKAAHILKTGAVSSFVRSFTGIGRRALFQKGLVVFQFSIATFLIVGALVVNGQLRFIQQKNMGFNGDQIVNIPLGDPENIAKMDVIKEELQKLPGVERVSTSANRPGGSDYGVPYQAVGLAADEQPAMRCLVVDEDFLETYEMEIAEGRSFSHLMPTDSTAYLINEAAAHQLGWEEPLGQQLSMPAVNREPGPIIGIVKDFHFHSLHEPITPLYFFMEKTWYSQFNVKLQAGKVDETLELIGEKWTEFEPDHPVRYTFFDRSFASLHAAEASIARIISWFTYLAVFITCLGLFGLSAYTTERRTKEIGIRKVFGASVADIFTILTKEVLVLVLAAVLIAAPMAWIAGHNWLENYAYAMNFGPLQIFAAVILAAAIAVLAVSYHVWRSAVRNPVKALRYE